MLKSLLGNAHVSKFQLFLKIIVILGVYLLTINLLIVVFHFIFNYPPSTMSAKDLFFGIWGYGWDGWHYLSIATTGYSFPNQAFFPLYPLLIRFLNLFLPLTLSYRVNLLLLPILLVLVFKFLKYLGVETTNKKLAVLIFFTAFPTFYFLQANYSETLFLILAVLSLTATLNKRYLLGAVFCALATACRLTGVALSITVVISYLYNSRLELRSLKILTKSLLLGVLCNLGLILYFLYLTLSFGSYQVFFEAEKQWFKSPNSVVSLPVTIGYSIVNAVPNTLNLIRNPPPSSFERKQALRGQFETLFLIFGIYLLVISFKKLPWELYIFSILSFLLPLSSGSTISISRYMLAMFPVILYWLSRQVGKNSSYLYIFSSSILQALFILMFISNVFIA